jgi:hypothetical protein
MVIFADISILSVCRFDIALTMSHGPWLYQKAEVYGDNIDVISIVREVPVPISINKSNRMCTREVIVCICRSITRKYYQNLEEKMQLNKFFG